MALAAQAPGVPVLDFTFNADADCSSGATGGTGPNGSYQYCAVKPTANDLACAPSSSAGTGANAIAATQCLGVLQNAPSASQGATVRMLGLSKMVVDGSGTAIVPGDWLKNDASGRGIKVTAPSSSQASLAMALAGSTAANDIITVFVLPQNNI